MYQLIIVIHVLLGLGIIGLIMIQQGKGADAGAAFGTGSSGSVFGAQGAASFLSRTTAIFAALFFVTSLGLAILNGRQGPVEDLMSEPASKQDTQAIPNIDGAKETETVPAQAPATPSSEQTQSPAAGEEIKTTEVPKAEEIKPVEIPAKAVSGAAKEPAKK